MHYSCEFNEEERGSIAIGLRDIEDASGNCAKFRPATTADKDWVAIDHKESGCSATVGYLGPGHGAHTMNLERSSSCTGKSTVTRLFITWV